MGRPLLDYILVQICEDYAIALEREIKSAAEQRAGQMNWREIDQRAVVVFNGPGVYDVWLDEQPLLRIEHVSKVERVLDEHGVKLIAAPLRVSLLA